MALLELESVGATYGSIVALHDISLQVQEGEIVTILGANGAGKTTTLRAISGTVKNSGKISFDGKATSRLAPEAIARLGIAHVPEGRGIFGELTVEENLRLGAYVRPNGAQIKEDVKRTLTFFPQLKGRLNQQGGSLSGGEQQMLALARALMAHPRLLLLDEPSLGLAPLVVQEFFRIVRGLNKDDGLTVLVVEQNASIALNTANSGYVIETGRVALEGPCSELKNNDSVRKAYLGY